MPGDSPIGLRLPLDSLPYVEPANRPVPTELDPLDKRTPLPPHPLREQQRTVPGAPEAESLAGVDTRFAEQERATDLDRDLDPTTSPARVVRTALCVEAREGRIHVFMPPLERLEDYLDLLAALEVTAMQTKLPVVIEGYLPPRDPRIQLIQVTPDPGVIEVNVHPTQKWDELVSLISGLYEDARLTRLGTEKFDLDGRHTGTGGGNHVVLGGATPADSPFLRRPDLLRSLLGYWNNHPSLSYLFSGTFVGPTSQAPRVDEGRQDAIYELEIAFNEIPDGGYVPPWLVDRTFRNLLVDITGNTHRAEFCIDKLYSPDSASGRLGLVELRAFEMPPHSRMSLVQQLLIRALVVKFWEQPYRQKLVRWGTSLHDRFLLPYFVWQDLRDVMDECRQAGLPLELDWLRPQFEFRFPKIGETARDDIRLEFRQAIEPWYVLGEEPSAGGTSRFVDSSVERLQVRVQGLVGARHAITCNGRKVPLHPTGVAGEYVAAVRYRAWQPPRCLHPNIPIHTPLVFDIVDLWQEKSLGGCTYYVAHPAGRDYRTFPVNAYEAESRRAARFVETGHTPGVIRPTPTELNPEYPFTLDLRRPSC